MAKPNTQALYEAMLNADLAFDHFSAEYNRLKAEHTARFLKQGKAQFDAEVAASKVPQVDDAAKKAIWFRAKSMQKSAMLQGLAAMREMSRSVADKDYRPLRPYGPNV